MKVIKIIGTAILAFVFTGNVAAQKTVAQPETAMTVNTADNPYLVDTKTFSTYFIGNKIPVDFPKYNSKLGEEAYQRTCANWAKKPDNYKLLSESGITTLKEYNASQAKAIPAPKK